MPLPEPMAMMNVVAGDTVIGSVFADRGGWVAWDDDEVWLGASVRSRFKTGELAIRAVEAAYAKRVGRKVTATGWKVAK